MATILILPLVVLLIHGGYRWLHTEVWLWGAKRHLNTVSANVLLPRLAHATRNRVLNQERVSSLSANLMQHPRRYVGPGGG